MIKKKVIVLSLGGSLIIPNNVDYKFLKKFKKVLLKNKNKYKFIVVCGGGSIARKYINALRKQGINKKMQSLAGISATRMNARFMTYFFNQDAEQGIPHTKEQVKNLIAKNNVVFCGSLRYHEKETSDSVAAELADYFKTNFINITNVPGLHNKNPLKYKNAKLISKITWKKFNFMANKLKYKPGQHFVLDQTASKIIMRKKIKTYIIGQNLKNLNKILKNKKFHGTIIEN